ncbi:oxidoreductase domain protein [Pirellula staleyi DSM 6068]|uniref:Oxidoreductase domain protein n=1 Tax=Pirellula staleyi (strain ATCC 27377 / DSM 6068 / ICPB 4128) TaxID=530564 RepID=D2R2X2_PIRSD|nr:Gfo/Idh/MocA family oxidoreductase [Pirellula staleyi]ADB18705.1 oxidoreductase domain protein [Pirellula staleyi DSM 6068]
MNDRQNSRRRFLQTTSAAAATAVAAPYFFSDAPAYSQDAKTTSKQDRKIIGCIGVGDRWNAVGPQALNFGDCVAVCDVDSNMTDKAKARVSEIQSKAGRNLDVAVFEDYQKLLERKDIEVVTIVTPDHWHSKIAIEAMKAGKDVYCEKPLTLTIDEGKQIVKVLKETGRVFQVGTQQRSEMGERFLTAVAICHAGLIGDIKKVQCAIGGAPSSPELPKADIPSGLNFEKWLGQAPLVDYVSAPSGGKYPHSRVHYEFRWWYEYSGGKMTDWGAHHVDIAQWAMKLDNTGPMTVEGTAKHPVPFKDGWPTVSNRYNAATEFNVKCMFPGDVELTIRSDTENGITIEGTKGTIFVSRGALRDVVGNAVAGLKKDNPLPEGFLTKLYKGKKYGNHMANFFDCIGTREQPISDVYTHHRAMSTCHLANIAIRVDRKIKWNAETEQIEGDEVANSFIKREARKGYEVTA